MTVLCSDKTGTLTLNHLTVENAWLNPMCALLNTITERQETDPKVAAPHPDNTLQPADIISCAALCSRVENHDPIDQAILTAYQLQQSQSRLRILPVQDSASTPSVPSLSELLAIDRSHFEQQSFLPFDATTRRTECRYHVTLPSTIGNPSVIELTCSKGAANTLMDLCCCSSEERALITAKMDENAVRGYRSLAVAVSVSSSPVPTSSPVRPHLLGVFSLYDPPRPDSAAVLTQLKALGVQVKMLTGDSHAVAVETARVLGMGANFVNIHQQQGDVQPSTGPAVPISQTSTPNTTTTTIGNRTKPYIPESPLSSPVTSNPVPAVTVLHSSPAQQSSSAHGATASTDATPFRYDWLAADGFAEVYPSDKHRIVSALQKAGHVVGMTGDGVNDSPSLKQAEVGVAVSNATDVAKSAASVVLLTEGLSGVLVLIKVGRAIHRRIVTWVINKIAKTLQTTLFVVVSFFITGFFPITAFDMVLLLLLIDFVTISLATDRVRINPQPEKWNILQLTKIAAVIGILSAGEAIAILMVAVYKWQLTEAEVNTFAFLVLYFFGICTTFIAREDRFFWSSLPSPLLIFVCTVEGIGVLVVCSVGVPELTGISFWQAIIVPFYAAGCSFIINDLAKMAYFTYYVKTSDAIFNTDTVRCVGAVPQTAAPVAAPLRADVVEVEITTM